MGTSNPAANFISVVFPLPFGPSKPIIFPFGRIKLILFNATVPGKLLVIPLISMARYAAKNLVAAGLARKCQIELAYAIGVAHPVSVLVDTYGTGRLPDERLAEIINRHFDLRPAAIIRDLDLRRPIYEQTAAYGHFGRTDVDLPWEKTDRAELLKQYL